MWQKVAIVGSGFLGLTLALRLAESGKHVTLYESAAEIGGLASTWEIGDVIWDKHYHVTLLSDKFTRKIVRDLGLEGEFNWVETRTGFYTEGKLVSMSNALEFLTFPPLGLIGKARLAATILYASRKKDWRSLERISVEDWLTKLSGKATFDKLWKPLLRAKLGDAYSKTSAAFIWATIQRLYAARRSGLRKEMFGYVSGGYARVLGRFDETLRSRGVSIRLNSKVDRVEKLETGQFRVAVSDSSVVDEDKFDRVVMTCPASVAARVAPQLGESEKSRMEAVKYQGIICASLLTKTSLSPFYVTNIIDETPFTGVIEMSALVNKAEFNGRALVYLPKYVESDSDLFRKSDKEIEELFLGALEKMYPNFVREDAIAFKVSRVRNVFPLPVLNYSVNLPSMETSVDGLFVVNSTHIVNGTLNVNETVQLAETFYAKYLSV